MRLTHRLILILLLCLLVADKAIAEREVHVFELDNRQAEALIPQLQQLYGGDDVVFSPDGQNLMVRARAEQLAEIDQLLRRLDRAAPQLRITLREGTPAEVQREQGSRVISTRRQQSRSVTVESGQVAQIRSGQIRYLPIAVRSGRDPTALLERVEESSGFLVTPTVISEQQVELQITALRDDPIASMPGYETAAVVTLRRVAPGEWVELGSERTEFETLGNSRVISTTDAGSEARDWYIKVDVLSD